LRDLTLAKDELYVRDADGIGRVVSIPLITRGNELLDQIAKVQKETASTPELILYPAGAPRNDSTRRIVTRDILIEADSRSAADILASASKLSFKSAPVYAQGKYIYEAPSSPEALAFFVKTADSESPYVTPLLGAQVAKRVMPNDQLIQKQWHLKFQNQFGAVSGTDMNVESVWKYPSTTKFNSSNATSGHIRGNGTTIGIVDDGMEWSHPDLLPNVKKNLQKDWNGKDNDPKPSWGDNHGTACAGVAAARGNNKIGVSGVAPEASLVGMRLIAGAKTDADEAEVFTWHKDAIEIKSNSWGPYDDAVTLEGPDVLAAAALKYAVDFGRNGKGTIITWAGGNGLQWKDNSNYDGYANSIYTIAVAAMDSYGAQSYYSERGANIVITAPSNGSAPALGIMTTDNKGPKGYNYGFVTGDILGHPDNTETFGGTSSATPAISGVIALMLQRNPNLGWRDVQEILMRSAAQVDSTDSDWITANRTDHVTGNLTVPFHFNHKYGAGLVDAAAAVALSGNWTNLKPQKSETVTTNATTPIDATGNANATITRTFTVNGTNLRVEHVTLALKVEDIPKGDLTVTLTSPGNTTSIFCEPHSDTFNNFENWKFMTVRNWAESSNGNWTLSITNNGTSTGNLTNTALVVYGTPTSSSATTTVTLAASTTLAPLSTNITLNATAVALGSNGSATGDISGVQFFQTFNGTTTLIGNGTLTGNATNPAAYTLLWNTANLTAGNYSITANATSSGNVTGVSNAVMVKLDPILHAGWDFQTLTSNRSSVPLATALMSVRTYNANFGSGNGALLFNGSNGSNQWSYANGEIFVGPGSALNAAAGFSTLISNPAALLLRSGRKLSANGKSLIFRCASTANKTYTINYAALGTPGGFTTHTWAWSNNATGTYTPLGNATIISNFTTLTFTTSNATSNGTLFLRLTPSGATSASGANLIDNIQIQSN
jgi:subtilisin family serine protease